MGFLNYSTFNPKPDGIRELIRNQLQDAIFKGYDRTISRKLTIDLKRYIDGTDTVVRYSNVFVNEIRRYIICLHKYNLSLKSTYPLSLDLKYLLMKYVEIEFGALKKTEDKTLDDEVVLQRVLRLLNHILYDALKMDEVSLEIEMNACRERNKAILTLFIAVGSNQMEDDKLIRNAIRQLLKELNENENLNQLRNKKILYHTDPEFKNSIAANLRERLTSKIFDNDFSLEIYKEKKTQNFKTNDFDLIPNQNLLQHHQSNQFILPKLKPQNLNTIKEKRDVLEVQMVETSSCANLINYVTSNEPLGNDKIRSESQTSDLECVNGRIEGDQKNKSNEVFDNLNNAVDLSQRPEGNIDLKYNNTSPDKFAKQGNTFESFVQNDEGFGFSDNNAPEQLKSTLALQQNSNVEVTTSDKIQTEESKNHENQYSKTLSTELNSAETTPIIIDLVNDEATNSLHNNSIFIPKIKYGVIDSIIDTVYEPRIETIEEPIMEEIDEFINETISKVIIEPTIQPDHESGVLTIKPIEETLNDSIESIHNSSFSDINTTTIDSTLSMIDVKSIESSEKHSLVSTRLDTNVTEIEDLCITKACFVPEEYSQRLTEPTEKIDYCSLNDEIIKDQLNNTIDKISNDQLIIVDEEPMEEVSTEGELIQKDAFFESKSEPTAPIDDDSGNLKMLVNAALNTERQTQSINLLDEHTFLQTGKKNRKRKDIKNDKTSTPSKDDNTSQKTAKFDEDFLASEIKVNNVYNRLDSSMDESNEISLVEEENSSLITSIYDEDTLESDFLLIKTAKPKVIVKPVQSMIPEAKLTDHRMEKILNLPVNSFEDDLPFGVNLVCAETDSKECNSIKKKKTKAQMKSFDSKANTQTKAPTVVDLPTTAKKSSQELSDNKDCNKTKDMPILSLFSEEDDLQPQAKETRFKKGSDLSSRKQKKDDVQSLVLPKETKKTMNDATKDSIVKHQSNVKELSKKRKPKIEATERYDKQRTILEHTIQKIRDKVDEADKKSTERNSDHSDSSLSRKAYSRNRRSRRSQSKSRTDELNERHEKSRKSLKRNRYSRSRSSSKSRTEEASERYSNRSYSSSRRKVNKRNSDRRSRSASKSRNDNFKKKEIVVKNIKSKNDGPVNKKQKHDSPISNEEIFLSATPTVKNVKLKLLASTATEKAIELVELKQDKSLISSNKAESCKNQIIETSDMVEKQKDETVHKNENAALIEESVMEAENEESAIKMPIVERISREIFVRSMEEMREKPLIELISENEEISANVPAIHEMYTLISPTKLKVGSIESLDNIPISDQRNMVDVYIDLTETNNQGTESAAGHDVGGPLMTSTESDSNILEDASFAIQNFHNNRNPTMDELGIPDAVNNLLSLSGQSTVDNGSFPTSSELPSDIYDDLKKSPPNYEEGTSIANTEEDIVNNFSKVNLTTSNRKVIVKKNEQYPIEPHINYPNSSKKKKKSGTQPIYYYQFLDSFESGKFSNNNAAGDNVDEEPSRRNSVDDVIGDPTPSLFPPLKRLDEDKHEARRTSKSN